MGKPITVSIPHALGMIEARRRIAQGFSGIQTNSSLVLGSFLSMEQRWEGDSLHFDAVGLGQKLSGRLDIRPNSVELLIDLPEIIALLADRFVAALKTGTQKLLE
jgi:hypothetical protein